MIMDILLSVLFLGLIVGGALLLVWAFAPGALSMIFRGRL